MAVFLLLPALVLLCIILLAPLMLPGAIVAFIFLMAVFFLRRHHPHGLFHLR